MQPLLLQAIAGSLIAGPADPYRWPLPEDPSGLQAVQEVGRNFPVQILLGLSVPLTCASHVYLTCVHHTCITYVPLMCLTWYCW
jgi:hypothetical protein